MSELLLKILPFLGTALVLFLAGRKSGQKKADKQISELRLQAEEEIRKANNRAGEAQAKATAAGKEGAVLKAAASAVYDKPKQRIIDESTRDEILSAINDMIKESTGK